ncbi:MAG: hypothetical protein K2G69_02440 [Muribaculaceae bacterium]|nr:hypothetical protein [Muribaculaceae bacterium]
MITAETIRQIEEMKGGDWIYNDRVVTILGSCPTNEGKEIEIYLNNGETIYTDYVNVSRVLNRFHPVAEQARLLQKKTDNTLSVCSGDVISELRDTLLSQIRKLHDNPTKETLAQSKAINETINQFTNLARTELEYKKMTFQLRKK